MCVCVCVCCRIAVVVWDAVLQGQRIHTCASRIGYVCMYVCIYIYIYIYILYACVYILQEYASRIGYVHACMYMLYVYVCCMYIYVYIYSCVHIHLCIHTCQHLIRPELFGNIQDINAYARAWLHKKICKTEQKTLIDEALNENKELKRYTNKVIRLYIYNIKNTQNQSIYTNLTRFEKKRNCFKFFFKKTHERKTLDHTHVYTHSFF